MVTTRADFWSGTTARARRFKSPLREFLRTESGGAAVLLAATVAALVWVNVDASSYEELWGTVLAIDLGGDGRRADAARVGEQRADDVLLLRAGSRGAARVRPRRVSRAAAVRAAVAGVGRRHGRRGGDLPRVQPRELVRARAGASRCRPTRRSRSDCSRCSAGGFRTACGRSSSRSSWSDDLLALVVIALVYSESIDVAALIWAAGLFAVALVLLLGLGCGAGRCTSCSAAAIWVALLESGIEPVVVGLAMGLLAWAYPAARSDLEHAGERFREFREQPTPELQRSARESIRTAISPNERLQLIYHPWTSYVIVPLFALANAGIAIDGGFLERAASSPITLGILVGYVAGKPLGIVGTALLVTWLSRGRLRPTVGWGAVAGAGASAGVGFTVSLLVATLAFDGAQLEEAKAGILAAAVGAAAVTWLVFRTIGTAAAAAPHRGPARRRRAAPRPRVRGRSRVGPHPRPARRARDRGRVRRLRVPVLRTGGARRARAAARLRRTSATSGGTCRSPTCIRTPSSRPRPPRPPPIRARSGRCTTCCSSTRTRCGWPIWCRTPTDSGSTWRASPRTCKGTLGRTGSPRTWRART